MSENYEKQAEELKQAEKNLITFLRSPNGRLVPDYLKIMMNLDGLFDPDSVTQTAYNLGAFETIAHLHRLGRTEV
jgi:hypothetical protein